MRFRLRTLLIAVAVVPALVSLGWYVLGFGNETYRRALRADSTIRDELLSATPRGTSAQKVLSYVVNELAHEEPADGYYEWVRAYDASTGRVSSIVPTDDRTIEVIVGERSAGFMMVELVSATWHFDGNDLVSDITVERYTFGP